MVPAHEAYDPEKHKNGNYTKPLQNYLVFDLTLTHQFLDHEFPHKHV